MLHRGKSDRLLGFSIAMTSLEECTMSDAFTMDAGARYAFAPSPDLFEGTLHRIYVVFEGSDRQRWTAGTELMAATRESAEVMCEQLNRPLGFDYDEWTAFAERVFAANPCRKAQLPKPARHAPRIGLSKGSFPARRSLVRASFPAPVTQMDRPRDRCPGPHPVRPHDPSRAPAPVPTRKGDRACARRHAPLPAPRSTSLARGLRREPPGIESELGGLFLPALAQRLAVDIALGEALVLGGIRRAALGDRRLDLGAPRGERLDYLPRDARDLEAPVRNDYWTTTLLTNAFN